MKSGLSDSDIVSSVIADLPLGVWVARAPGGEFVYANRAFNDIIGMGARSDVAVGEYAAPYGIHRRSGELYPEEGMPFVRALREGRAVTVDDIVIHRPDGQRVFVRAEALPVRGPSGEVSHVVIAFSDMTREATAERARIESEAKLTLAQKMESIGKLAGGIAHDFNNLLGAIKILASGMRRQPLDARTLACLEKIEEVADSATELTRSLLGFARRSRHPTQRVPLNDLTRSLADLALRTMDRRIEIRLEPLASPGVVRGDTSQLEQVLLNLTMNARDAMPDGGALTLRTLDAEALADPLPARLARGPYVVLEVIDTGTGIAPEVRDLIFEPYFTTKTQGEQRGTGLGLATVYGIVESHSGAIEVLAGTPRGTTMRVYLPRSEGAWEQASRPAPAPALVARGEGRLLLLIDDEPFVRDAAERALRELGYRVLLAGDGAEAVELFLERGAEIDGVLLDLVMPRLDGRATFARLRAERPEVPVLLISGLHLDDAARELIEQGARGFLAKPFDIVTLSQQLARMFEPDR